MKHTLILLLFFSSSFAAYPQNSDKPVIFGKMLAELKEPQQPEWPLLEELKISPELSAPLDTGYNWQLLYYQKRGWREITGQKASHYKKTYNNTKPEMRFSSALLKKTFALADPGSAWKIRQQPSASGNYYLVISSCHGNPYANITSWEEEEFYVFTKYGVDENRHFKLDHLLEESADPTPFQGEKPITGEIVSLKPYTVADTGKWQLLGYEGWTWENMLGENIHATDYRKYTANTTSIFGGKELRKEFSPGEWQSYILDNRILVIQMSIYQPGNMTDYGYVSGYYFRSVK